MSWLVCFFLFSEENKLDTPMIIFFKFPHLQRTKRFVIVIIGTRKAVKLSNMNSTFGWGAWQSFIQWPVDKEFENIT